MENLPEKEFGFFVLLAFSFFVFVGYANLHRPFKMIRHASAMVLSDSTSSGDGSTTVSPTPTSTPDNSSSGDNTTTTFSPTPAETSTGSSADNPTINTPTPTIFTESTIEDTSLGGTTTDRLASVDSATLSCIKSRLTSSEFDTLRYLIPTNSSEEETLKQLKEKAQVCFAGYSETKNINQATSFVSELPQDSESCLVKSLGEDAFKEISSGFRKPTVDEKAKAQACFPQSTNIVKLQTQKQALSSDIDKCLLLALGTKRLSEVKKGGTTLTLDEREKAQRCFGVSSNPLKPHVTYSLPDDVKGCISKQVPDERLEELKLGKDKPSDTEKEGVKNCLSSLNEVQVKIVPAPPEEVPFLDEDSDRVELKSSFTETIAVNEKMEDRHLVLAGRGPKDSLIDIYIYSDPIVVTTQTDENGDFVYRMTEPLDQGSHIAYVVYKEKDGTSVRSSIYNFDVQAASSPQDALLNESQASSSPARFITYAVTFILGALTLSAFGAYLALKSKKEVKSSEGNSENEGGAGSIN